MAYNKHEMVFIEQMGGKFERYINHHTAGTLRTSNVDAICFGEYPPSS